MSTHSTNSAASANSGKLQDKIALVTGGNSGIGLATAQRFAAEGATVFVTGRRQAELDAAVRTIPGAIGVQGDISRQSDLDRLFAVIKDKARSRPGRHARRDRQGGGLSRLRRQQLRRRRGTLR